MFGMGMPELIFIGLFGLLVFGPRKLPEIGRKIGEIMGQLRNVSDDFKRTWETEVHNEKARVLDVDAPPARAAGVSAATEPTPTIAPPPTEVENTLSRSPFKTPPQDVSTVASGEIQTAAPAALAAAASARRPAVIDGYEG
jgi:Sec-independent protein translocase protein TatA